MSALESLYKSETYLKISVVMESAKYPIAPHEFSRVFLFETLDPDARRVNGRKFVNMTEVSIKRRLNEMVKKGIATSAKRAGKQFHEFALVKLVDEFHPDQTDA